MAVAFLELLTLVWRLTPILKGASYDFLADVRHVTDKHPLLDHGPSPDSNRILETCAHKRGLGVFVSRIRT